MTDGLGILKRFLQVAAFAATLVVCALARVDFWSTLALSFGMAYVVEYILEG